MANYKLFFDGSCNPNPLGTAAYSFALMLEGQQEPLEHGSGVIGVGEGMTNNGAEFHALWRGLLAFHKHTGISIGNRQHHSLQVYGDSNLVVQVMNRHWKARSDKAYFKEYEIATHTAVELRKAGAVITYDWIPRERNTICDDLSKAHQKKVA